MENGERLTTVYLVKAPYEYPIHVDFVTALTMVPDDDGIDEVEFEQDDVEGPL